MRFIFSGQVPGELANGRPLAYGDVVDLTQQEAESNSRLIEEGLLMQQPSPRNSKKTKAQERDK